MTEHSHYRIIASNMNIAIVEEKGIGEESQSRTRFIVVGGDGFFGKIAAGHDEGEQVESQRSKVGIGKEKVMQRRVR